jgi:GST-like protein
MAGQAHHFRLYAPEKIPYAINRYTKECGRLYRVLDRRLADRAFVAGDYSIADMACYPWIRPDRQGQDMSEFPNLARWHAAIQARPAVERAYAIAKRVNDAPAITDEASRRILFEQDQNTVR